ncbi:MAG TPA: ATP-binding protein [Bryobacteraceae bacterium]|nr:ATP-binding protein [Bryobacteraceae bacterium]
MNKLFSRMPLRWRLFTATSITITFLFVVAGWVLQNYALSVADESVRSEIRASIQAYEAMWKARTQVLSDTTALMGAMSDVRAAFQTGDRKTINDSASELWSRISDESAAFVVLDPEGQVITSLGAGSNNFSLPQIQLQQVRKHFPGQLAGYLLQDQKLFYVVLTPVYVQTSYQPMLLNVLCAGFRIDDRVAAELKKLVPTSDVVFLNRHWVFASTLDSRFGRMSPAALSPTRGSDRGRLRGEDFVSASQTLMDVMGRPIAELRILHSYEAVDASLGQLRRSLALAWFVTVAVGLLVSLVMTYRLLDPIRVLVRAAAEITSRNYSYRVPLHGNDEVSRLAATFNEMCESIERARADLIRQEQMDTIGRLGSSLVHDLRNPLAAIYGGAEMLMDGNLPAEHTKRIASNIYRASHRMQELLRDLLNVSRGETGNIECCRLRDIVDAAADSIVALSAGVHIDIRIPATTEIVVDRTRSERVFTNLLSNAAEAMPEGGDIFVYIKDEGEDVTVFVKDTGSGVPDEVRAQLFRPFVTAGKRSGLGLGLTLSRQTMLELGGDLDLVHEPGSGACFRLRFPKSRVGLPEQQTQTVA